MNRSMQVYKFGGLSIKDAESVKNVTEIIRSYKGDRLVVVLSAMGKMTRLLGVIIQACFDQAENHKQFLEEFRDYHNKIMDELNIRREYRNEILSLITELENRLEQTSKRYFDFYYDQSVCYGELISSKIVSIYLSQQGIVNTWHDVRQMIRTNNEYRAGKVDWYQTPALIQEHIQKNDEQRLLVTQGFIGKSKEGHSISLGFEGSDYTAAIIAHSLSAEKLTIWKDVEGIMNCDPKKYTDAIKINEMSFHDAAELSFMGAKVIHPSTIKPLQVRNIPLEVRSCIYKDRKGTIVSNSGDKTPPPMFTVKKNQFLMQVVNGSMNDPGNNLLEVIQMLDNKRIKLNFAYPGIYDFWFAIDHNDSIIDQLGYELSQDFQVNSFGEVEIIQMKYPDKNTIENLTKGKEIIIEVRTEQKAVLVIKQKI